MYAGAVLAEILAGCCLRNYLRNAAKSFEGGATTKQVLINGTTCSGSTRMRQGDHEQSGSQIVHCRYWIGGLLNVSALRCL
jgi:hypothetical protein